MIVLFILSSYDAHRQIVYRANPRRLSRFGLGRYFEKHASF
jgi:hypothetical protein